MHSLRFKRFRELLLATFLIPCYGLFGAGIAFAIEWVAGRPMNDTSDLMMANILLSAGMTLLSWFFIQDKGVHQDMHGGTLSVLATVICGNIVLNALVLFFSSAFPDKGYDAVQHTMSSQDIRMMLFYTLCIAPVCEEMVYRRLILHRLGKVFPCWFAIALSGILFGIFHGNVTQGIYAGLIGMVFGMVYQKHSLKMAVLAHVAFNATSVLLGLMGAQEVLSSGGLACLSVMIFAVLGLGFGLRYILHDTTKAVSESVVK